MRVFICDDDQNRIDILLKRYKGHVVFAVTHYDDAMPLLLSQPAFDLYLLDHDLESFATDPETGQRIENTGTELAEAIVKDLPKDKYPDTVICHSYNSQGGKRMGSILKEAGIRTYYSPFKVNEAPYC